MTSSAGAAGRTDRPRQRHRIDLDGNPAMVSGNRRRIAGICSLLLSCPSMSQLCGKRDFRSPCDRRYPRRRPCASRGSRSPRSRGLPADCRPRRRQVDRGANINRTMCPVGRNEGADAGAHVDQFRLPVAAFQKQQSRTLLSVVHFGHVASLVKVAARHVEFVADLPRKTVVVPKKRSLPSLRYSMTS
jgi:hypothetical protein